MKYFSVFLKQFILSLILLLSSYAFAQRTQIKYLSGIDKDNTVDWEFMISGGRNSRIWSRIPVPSNWEMQGFGTYRYGNDWSHNPVPDSIGYYRYKFTVPVAWRDRKVDMVFGGSMTDTEVKINGRTTGAIQQGGFYEFRYNITDLLNFNLENLLEVKVGKYSSNTSINLAERRVDFWLFGGIYRPVWLEAFPSQHIKRIAINAKHTGDITILVFLDSISTADRVTGQIKQIDGTPIGQAFSTNITAEQDSTVLRTKVNNIKPWSAEWPYRYQVQIKLEENKKTVHEVSEKFGFRTIDIRAHDGIYINNVKVRLKGVNRHSFWPTSGRTTSKEVSILDVNLMKDMNMNAVRMSHYPPDKHFLDVTDSLGLFVINELTGWQDKYDTEVGRKLVRELVIRDVNHPSVIMWANGNEGGWNYDLDDDYAQWDPQQRIVIHPWENFNGINTAHYEVYNCCSGTFFQGEDLIMPTEFLHGLFDGGLGAGLDDWWNLMLRNPLAVGGFLWAFADEGIVRMDKGGMVDAAGNRAPDGILGPFREKEGSFYTIKEIWSPVYFELSEQDNLPVTFTGIMQVKNRYDYTNLNQINFSWQLVDFPVPFSGEVGHEVRIEGSAASPFVLPNQQGTLYIDLPKDWRNYHAFFLTATDMQNREIYTWSWMIPEPKELAKNLVHSSTGKASGTEKNGMIVLMANGIEVKIDVTTGQLYSATCNGTVISLSKGPRLVSGEATLKDIKHYPDGNDYVVEANYDGNLKKIHWRMLPNGWLQLNYAYYFGGHTMIDYLGVTFDYPEDKVTGLRWLGKGPHRVWKNRLKGTEFDVWYKDYNNAITGVNWEYPEFKGFYADIYWATLETEEAPITMVIASDNIFMRVFTPEEPSGEAFDPRMTHVDFPIGDLSFLNGIAPIGTKFHAAAEHGPAGLPNMVPRLGKSYKTTVYFYFGSDLPNTLKQ